MTNTAWRDLPQAERERQEYWLRSLAKLLSDDPLERDVCVGVIVGEMDNAAKHGRIRLFQRFRNTLSADGLGKACERFAVGGASGFDHMVERGWSSTPSSTSCCATPIASRARQKPSPQRAPR